MFLLKLSFRPWRIAPFSQLFSAAAVGLLLFMTGFLTWMHEGLNPLVARMRAEQVVTAYLNPEITAADEDKLIDSIQIALGAHSITEIGRVTPEQFIENLKGIYPDLSRELADLGAELHSVVPRYLSISGTLPSQAADQIRQMPGVRSADSSKDRYRHIVGAFSALKWVTKIFVLGLCLAIFTGLIHLMRMNAYLHKDALGLLRLWGAGDLALRAPGFISGLWVGILGGAMALLAWITGGSWLIRQIRGLSPLLKDIPPTEASFPFLLLFAGMVLGMLAGGLGTGERA